MDHEYARDEAYCDYARELSERNKGITVKAVIPHRKSTEDSVYWELGDGKKVNIDLMSVTHLRNVLKLIVRKNLLKDK